MTAVRFILYSDDEYFVVGKSFACMQYNLKSWEDIVYTVIPSQKAKVHVGVIVELQVLFDFV